MKLGKLLKSVNAHQTVVYIVFYLIIPVHALKFKEGIDFLGSPDGGQFFSSPGRVRGGLRLWKWRGVGWLKLRSRGG